MKAIAVALPVFFAVYVSSPVARCESIEVTEDSDAIRIEIPQLSASLASSTPWMNCTRYTICTEVIRVWLWIGKAGT
jgi:hypothetical protein